MSISFDNFESSFGLAQVFNVLGAYTPSKASVFLRKFGDDPTSFFTVDSDTDAVVDASNFIAINQTLHSLVFGNEEYSGYLGSGYMEFKRSVKVSAKNGQIYVSSLASGGGDGSFDNPYTWAEVLGASPSYSVSAGDRIVILADGDYSISNSSATWNFVGTSSQPIEIYGANANGAIDGTKPVIVISNFGLGVSIFDFDGSDYLTVGYLRFEDGGSNLLNTVFEASTGSKITNWIGLDFIGNSATGLITAINSAGDGAVANSGEILIEDCFTNYAVLFFGEMNTAPTTTIRNCVLVNDFNPASGSHGCHPNAQTLVDGCIFIDIAGGGSSGRPIALAQNSDNSIIRNCTFIGSENAPISTYSGYDNLLVENCIFIDTSSADGTTPNGAGTEQYLVLNQRGDTSWDATIRNCCAFHTTNSSPFFVEGMSDPQDVDEWKILGNNLYVNVDFVSTDISSSDFYRPVEDSATIGSATDGSDMGYLDAAYDSSEFPSLYYPLDIDVTGKIYVYVRMQQLYEDEVIGYQVFYKGNELAKIESIETVGSWSWLSTEIVIPESDRQNVEIRFHRDSSALADAVYVSSSSVSGATLAALTDSDLDSNYVTIHSKVFTVDSNLNPLEPLNIYDSLNNVNDIKSDSWYNLSLSALEGRSLPDFDDSYALVLYSSGDTNTSYIVWDFGSSEQDPYLPAPALKSSTVGDWIQQQDQQSLMIWSFRDSLDETGCKITTPPAELAVFNIDRFDIAAYNPKFLNTKIVSEGDGTNRVELDLPDRLISILMDHSGSMSWNDQDGVRFDMARRLINRVDATYPGDVRFNVFSFGGAFIKSDFIGIIEDDQQDFSAVSNVQSAVFADPDNNFAGVRVVRKEGSYPQTPIDGDIILDSFTDISFNEGLEEGTRYFYTVFTFDENDRFSVGRNICATPRIRQVPQGITAFNQDTLYGIGLTTDENTVGVWHFDDGFFLPPRFLEDPRRLNIFDFGSFQSHLQYQGTFEPQWLLGNVPVGYSGIKLSGASDEYIVSQEASTDLNVDVSSGGGFTMMGWFNFSFLDLASLSPVASQGIPLMAVNEDGVSIVNTHAQISLVPSGSGYAFSFLSAFGSLSTVEMPMERNRWYHIAVVVDPDDTGDEIKIYLDGVKVDNSFLVLFGFTPSTDPQSFWIGYNTLTAFTYPNMSGSVSEVSYHNIPRGADYILSASQRPTGDARVQDNGDRLVLLNFTIPDDYDFVGGNIRINRKLAQGPREVEIIQVPRTLDGGFFGVAPPLVSGFEPDPYFSDPYGTDDLGTTLSVNEREVIFYGEAPSWEEDGDVVYDSAVSGSGEFTITSPGNYIHGQTYYFRIFSQNTIGNYSFLSDSPSLEVEIPKITDFEEALIAPVPDLTPVTLDGDPTPGNKKVHVKWINPQDSRIDQIKVYYRSDRFPTIDEIDIDESDGTLVYKGDTSVNNFVHRGLPNDFKAYYLIVAGDGVGFHAEPVYASATPTATADESTIPLREVKTLTYEVVDEASLSIKWVNPIKIDNSLEAWFDQRIVLFARITDEFGRTIIDSDAIKMEVSGSISSNRLAADVFDEEIEQPELPRFEDVVTLTQSSIENGVIKGILRLSPGLQTLSEFREIFAELNLGFSIVDPDTQETVFTYNKVGPTVVFKNPWKMGLINQSGDNITVRCDDSGGSWLDRLLGELSGGGPSSKRFTGTYCRREAPVVLRAWARYREAPIPPGNRVQVGVYNAEDPQCADGFKPEFTTIKATDVTPPSGFMEFRSGRFVISELGSAPVQASYVDIPLTSPRIPKAVMVFAKAQYNGYESRRNLYVVYENILQVDLSAYPPEPNCSDVNQFSAYAYLIDPDNPGNTMPVPDFEVVRWQYDSNVPDKEVPFFSTDSVEISGGVYSFTRNGRAQNVFFGPLCDVRQLGFTNGPFGPEPIYETYYFGVSITYDGLTASDQKSFEVQPYGTLYQQFGDRLLMHMRGFTEYVWADGFDRAELTIEHEPATTDAFFSGCFRQCASQDGAFLFPLAGGQVVDVASNSLGSGVPIKMTWGDDVDITYDPYLDEEVISGGVSQFDYAQVDLSKTQDKTVVYITANGQVDDPPQRLFGDSSYLGLLTDLARPENACSCAPGANEDTPPKFSTDYFFTGESIVYFEDSVFYLSGGGDWETGIPPCRIQLREPLKLRLAYIRNLETGERVQSLTIDGLTSHEIVYAVSFSGKNVPENIPVFFELGGDDASTVLIESNVGFVRNVIDEEIDANNITSVVSVTLLPLTPIRGVFSFQLQASVSYDKKNEIDRVRRHCSLISYDATPQIDIPLPPPPPDDDDEEEIDDDLFEAGGYVYDSVSDVWSRITAMNFARGALTLTWSFDPYGEKLYAVGGLNNSQILTAVEEYDIASGTWSVVAPMSTPRFFHMAVEVDGYIYVMGGLTFNVNDEILSVSSSVERYDPFSDTWETIDSMPGGVAMGVAQYVDGKIYVLCGIDALENNSANQQGDLVSLNSAIYAYDIETASWSTVATFEDEDLELYGRMYPFVLTNDTDIYVLAGAKQIQTVDPDGEDIVTLSFLTESFKFDSVSETIEVSDGDFSRVAFPRFRGGSATYDNNHYFIGGESLVSQAGDLAETINTDEDPFGYSVIASLIKGLSSFGTDSDTFGNIYVVGGLTSGRPPGFLTVDAEADRLEAELDGKQSVTIKIKLRDSTGTTPDSVRVVVRGYLLFPCFKESEFEGDGSEGDGVSDDFDRDGGSDESQQAGIDNIDRFALIYPVNFTRNEFFIENGVGTTTILPRSEDVLRQVDEIKEKLGVEDDELFGAAGCAGQPDIISMFEGREDRPYKIRIQITIVDDFYFGQSLLVLEDLLEDADDAQVVLGGFPGPGGANPNTPDDSSCFEVDGVIICEEEGDVTDGDVADAVGDLEDQVEDATDGVDEEVSQTFSDCVLLGFSLVFPQLTDGGEVPGSDPDTSGADPSSEGEGTPSPDSGSDPASDDGGSGTSEPSDDPDNPIEPTTDPVPIGVTVENLLDLFSTSSSFNIVPSEIPQADSPTIQYVARRVWLPIVREFTTSNSGTADDALLAIQRLQFSDEIGASPFFDGLVEIAQTMQESTGDGFKKSIYTFVDNEESISTFTIDEAIEEINSIDGFQETPVIVNNLSVVFPVTLSALLSRTDTESLDRVAVETSGQSVSILSEDFVDEALNNSLGRVIGSIGYGTFEYTVDLGDIAVVNSIAFDSILYPNTDGNWRVAASDDGANFSVFSDQFDLQEEVTFTELGGRYFKFEITLLSGLSASIQEAYELEATPGAPSITDIQINYSVPATSYIYIDPEITENSVQQVAVSVQANQPLLSSVKVGAIAGKSFNWDDYSSGSQPLIDQYGKIFLPLRVPKTDAEIAGSFSDQDIPEEQLEYVDGFAWRASYDQWSPDAIVTVFDASGNSLEEGTYEVYPRDGLVVFPDKKPFDASFSIKIENVAETRIGIEIANRFAGETVEIEGLGYFWNTNTFLPSPLAESPPVASNLSVDPTSPFIFSTINALYDYFDANRDAEDLTQTTIVWYINGNPRAELNNFRTWNNINDFSDPVWRSGYFSFRPEDVPSGVSIEQFARERAAETGVPEGLLRVGDLVYFEVTPHDGKAPGVTVRSPAVTISETPPFATNIEIKGRRTTGPFVDTVTTATFAVAVFEYFTDSTDEGDRTQIVWTVNGSEFKRGPVNGTTNGFPNNQISPREINTDGDVGLVVGNTLRVSLIPSTQITEGTVLNSETITVQNDPPRVSNVRIDPTTPEASSNLRVSYTFVDEDVSVGNTQQSDQSTIQWFRKQQGETEFSEVATVAGSEVVSSTETVPGDIWKVRVTPFDGVSAGTPSESFEVEIRG